MASKEHLNLFKGRIQDTLSSRARSSARASKCILDTITCQYVMPVNFELHCLGYGKG